MSSRWCLENWQGSVRQGPKDTVYPLRELRWTPLTPQRAPKQCPANGVRRILWELFPNTVCWTRLRNTWSFFLFFVALILGKFYAYSPWKSLLRDTFHKHRGQGSIWLSWFCLFRKPYRASRTLCRKRYHMSWRFCRVWRYGGASHA